MSLKTMSWKTMSWKTGSWKTIAGIGLIALSSAALGAFTAAELILGDGTFPKLRVWGFEDLTGTPALYVSKTVEDSDRNSVSLYQLIPDGVAGPAAPFGSATRTEGQGSPVGGFFYAENDGQGGVAFGLNAIAATYSGAPAVGMEVNGVNRSGEGDRPVRGIDVVNGGNAPTEWAIGIQTSANEPAGKPQYGIVLGGPAFGYRHNPASEVGLFVDRIDSGRAIEIRAGDAVVLNGRAGDVRMLYNEQTEQIEFYRGGDLRFVIPMSE